MAAIVISTVLAVVVKQRCIRKTAQHISDGYRGAYDETVAQKAELDQIEREYYDSVVALKQLTNKKAKE
ncbi:MAG: hypothetical protein LBL66_06135 [Clostridiales bacterium]|nr:hypothetical protein [Clostridiales bacterium]